MRIIKRAGHDEPYDERKVYGSVYAAMLAAHQPTKTAELVASDVSARVTKEVVTHVHTSSDEIKHFVTKELAEFSKHAQFLYVHHKRMF
jgi:transcriptional regulator NrdR family protein